MFRRVAIASTVALTAYGVNAHYARCLNSSDPRLRKTSKLSSNTDVLEKKHFIKSIFSLNNKRNEIRVLVLSPAAESQDLRCDLKVVSLDDKPTYTALSYTWGEPIRPSASPWSLRGIYQFLRALFWKYWQPSVSTIYLSGKPIKVTPNLASALLHLRDPEKA
jgi:hypothetical protein